jgi:transposase
MVWENSFHVLINRKNIAKVTPWANILMKMNATPAAVLAEYFLRNACESGFSMDKRKFGGILRQKKEDRQDTALFSNAFLHNLYVFRIRLKPNCLLSQSGLFEFKANIEHFNWRPF